ncbi:hypothetical protein ACP8Y2_23615 [Herpetosiphon llansteffanensis]
MALDFYLLEDTFLEKDNFNYIEYFQLQKPKHIASMELAEYYMLAAWVTSCRTESLGIEDYFSDSLLRSSNVPRAIVLLEQAYASMSDRSLFQPASGNSTNPFHRMHAILDQAQPNYGILALCD